MSEVLPYLRGEKRMTLCPRRSAESSVAISRVLLINAAPVTALPYKNGLLTMIPPFRIEWPAHTTEENLGSNQEPSRSSLRKLHYVACVTQISLRKKRNWLGQTEGGGAGGQKCSEAGLRSGSRGANTAGDDRATHGGEIEVRPLPMTYRSHLHSNPHSAGIRGAEAQKAEGSE